MLRRRPPSRQNLPSDGFSGWQLGHFMLGCQAPRKASCTPLWRRIGPSKPIAGTEEDQGLVRGGDAGIVAKKVTVDNRWASSGSLAFAHRAVFSDCKLRIEDAACVD